MAEYRKEMGAPPVDIDHLSALPAAKRRVAEARVAEKTSRKQPGKKSEKDLPIPTGGMVRSGGKMVPRFARDMGPDEPIPARGMRDMGSGLETIPDEARKANGGKVKGYASGGAVTRADGCCKKGHTKGKMR